MTHRTSSVLLGVLAAICLCLSAAPPASRAQAAPGSIVPGAAPPPAQGGLEPIKASDLLHLRWVTSVQVSPDAAFAVYSVRSIAKEPVPPGDPQRGGDESFAYRTHLWMVRFGNGSQPGAGAPVQLTFGDRSDSDPRISPDARSLAFVRAADAPTGPDNPRPARGRRGAEAGHKPQVWVMPLDGPGEARPVTDLEFGATSPRWRPDSSALLVVSAFPQARIAGKPEFPQERPGREWGDFDTPDPNRRPDEPGAHEANREARPDGDARAVRNWLERDAAEQNPNVITRLDFQDELALKGGSDFSQFFIVDPAGSAPPRQITSGFRDRADPCFSPDGKEIAFVSSAKGAEHPDRINRNAIWRIGADGADEKPLLDDPQFDIDEPLFSPDGRALLWRGLEMADRNYSQSHLGALTLADKKRSWLTATWDSGVGSAVIEKSGDVLFQSAWQGDEPIMRCSLTDIARPPKRVVQGAACVGAFDAAGGRIVASITTPENPCELYLLDAAAEGGRTRLTELNTGWLKNKAISIATQHWLANPNGTRVEYWVMPPAPIAGAKLPGKQPTVLQMHGGPSAMWGPAEFTMWQEFQTFCSAGYAVVYCNPRGSSGYGYAFQKGNHKDWGDGPTADVLGCLDEAVKQHDWIDPDRLFITGGSYAGYLTAWIIGHDQRFKAACAQRGVYDLKTFFGEGNAWRLVEEAFGGMPWDKETSALLDRESPFTYVEQIKTPFLILHSSNDLRTGVTQSEMLYRALKVLKRPVEYLRYPNSGHELSRSGDPRQRIDRLLRMVEFFDRFRETSASTPSGSSSPAR